MLTYKTGRAKLEPLSKLQCYRLILRADLYDLVVHQRVVRIAVAKGDLAGLDVEGHYWCIPDKVAGVLDAHQWRIILIPNRARFGGFGEERN